MKNIFENNLIRPVKKLFHVIESEVEAVKLKYPSKNLKIIAVTGTSGKSSTSAMIFHILKANGYKVGIISTVGAVARDKNIDTGLHVTTPDAKDLQRILKKMIEENIEYVVLEASSHSIEQGRLGLLKLDYAVYTNIKRDHLDWHGSWENYAKAKAGLISKLKKVGKVIVNQDDNDAYNFLRHYYYSQAKSSSNFIEYSASKEVTNIQSTIDGVSFNYQNSRLQIPILGDYNIENFLAAAKVAQDLGLSVNDLSSAISTFKGLEGRMEIMQKQPFMVIVDFAHNSDSLERSLKAVKKIDGAKRIISVFGSAGLRDKEKRFTMGETAGKYSNVVIVTSEDPRTESLKDINTRIIEGATKSGGKLVKRFSNHEDYLQFLENKNNLKTEDLSIYSFDEENVNSRFDAVDFAIRIANAGDVVVTEGKGHEKSLCFGTTEYPFTDQKAVELALK